MIIYVLKNIKKCKCYQTSALISLSYKTDFISKDSVVSPTQNQYIPRTIHIKDQTLKISSYLQKTYLLKKNARDDIFITMLLSLSY